MKAKNLLFAAMLLIILLPSAALAVDFDYYVYGGFDAVVNAFNKLALVFGDNGYMSFYAFSIAAGIFFGCVTIAARILGGGNGSPMSWIIPALVGIGVYLSLVVPKGTLHVYDPVYNKNQAIGGIPAGVVAVAGILNAVERGLVDIVTTSGDPMSYQSQAGGKGFLGLYQITSLPLSAVNTNIDTSMRNYIKDCVSYEIMRPGTTLTVDALRRSSTDFTPLLAQAQNPSIYTVYYDSTTPNGQSMTCTNAWTNISAQLTPANLGNNLNAVCSALGYDPTDAASLTQCKTVLNNVNTGAGLGAASVEDFVKQAYISQRLDEIFRSGNATGATNYQFLLNASGSMKAANEWLPVLRAVLTAVAVGLIPFLALFIPTPIIGKAVGAIFGFFVWLTAWGVVDAIIHQFAIDYANSTYQLVRQNNLGMDAFYFFPDQTTKILGMFGTLRMSGMMLATVLTGMLVKFGGHAMAMMAGSLSGQIQSAGSRAAHEVEDPTGRASSIQRNSSAMPTQAWGNEHSFWARGAAAKAEMDYKTGDGLSLGSEGFSQGYNARQVSMGTTDAFVKSGDPRASAALGTSMVKAPTGIMATSAGQNWMKHSTKDGKIATLTSGQQKLTFSNDMITDASGMHLGIKYGEGIKAGYAEAKSQTESQAEKFDMMTGRNFMSSLTNSSGSTSMEAIGRKYSVSQGTAHELSKSLSNTASIIGSKATSIKDEHGNSVSKDAFASFVAQVSAGTPFGSIAPINVSGSAQGGYKVSGTTSEGTTHSFSVDVADRKGVEKAVGESWRDTSSRLRSTDLSSNDQKAIGEMMQVSSTESTTTQAGAAWSRARSLEKRESEEVAQSLSSSQDYDTALVKWYGDKKYGEMPQQERYANAASDLNNMATRADKGAINRVFGDFMSERALAPEMGDVRGNHTPVQAPTRSPSSLDNTAEEIGGAHDRIKAVKNGVPEPTPVPSNIRGKISAAHPSTGLKGPDPQLRRYLNLIHENVEGSGKEMGRISASSFGPLAQSAPLIPLVAPTARGASVGRYPDNSITDFDPAVAADTLKRGVPILFPEKHPEMAAGIIEGAEKIFSRSGIAKPGGPNRMNIGGER
jgi:hypothetical protein